MGSLARDHSDPGLLGFVRQLLSDSSLDTDCEAIARALVEQGADSLSADERLVLEAEIIEPYLGDCEACGATPSWQEMLHVYDTGLCAGCFERLEATSVPAVRPDWMPLAAVSLDDEELPDGEQVALQASLGA